MSIALLAKLMLRKKETPAQGRGSCCGL